MPTARMVPTPQPGPDISRTFQIDVWSHPPGPLLETVLSTMVADPICAVAYTDAFPRTVDAWLETVERHAVYPWLWTVNETPGGFYYLHDLGVDRDGPFAWIGTYVVPQFRGPERYWYWQTWRMMLPFLPTQRVFAAARHTNKGAVQALRFMGFTFAGTFPYWHRFEGAWDDVQIFAWRAEDTTAAWESAAVRHVSIKEQYAAVLA